MSEDTNEAYRRWRKKRASGRSTGAVDYADRSDTPHVVR